MFSPRLSYSEVAPFVFIGAYYQERVNRIAVLVFF